MTESEPRVTTDTFESVSPADDPSVDGRVARRERNRRVVLDTAIALFAEGNLQPTPSEIARHCGVSHRSINRYFPDNRSLLRAAVDRQIEVGVPKYRLHAIGRGPLQGRIDEFVRVRLDGFEALGADSSGGHPHGDLQPNRPHRARRRTGPSVRPGRPPVRAGVRRAARGSTCVESDGHRRPVPVRITRLLLSPPGPRSGRGPRVAHPDGGRPAGSGATPRSPVVDGRSGRHLAQGDWQITRSSALAAPTRIAISWSPVSGKRSSKLWLDPRHFLGYNLHAPS